MESIGTLAGGIAHDFNNILAAILGNVALAQGDLGARNPAQRSLEQIQRAGLRGRHLVQQILAFSRRDQPGLVSQALAPIMEECVGLLQAVLPAGVSLEALSPPEPVHVLADATQILQVLLNLCTNAWHALPPEGGRIELGLERLHPSEALRRAVPDLPEGECAHLWVKDNGSGMDEATRQRIFDPFFTTKAVGQGTGLGLSVVHGVVRSHSACMQLDSTLGQGSVFHLYFALEAEPKPPAASANALALPVLGEQAVRRVLYIDDDEVMALMVERILARAGFAVKAETDAATALAWLRAHPTGADVVVTDFNMPELSGFDVASQVEVICPGLPVVLSTGFLSDALRQKAAELGIQALVHKERSFEELGEVLQRMFRSA
jgi:CheY-like chemotaxis protein